MLIPHFPLSFLVALCINFSVPNMSWVTKFASVNYISPVLGLSDSKQSILLTCKLDKNHLYASDGSDPWLFQTIYMG